MNEGTAIAWDNHLTYPPAAGVPAGAGPLDDVIRLRDALARAHAGKMLGPDQPTRKPSAPGLLAREPLAQQALVTEVYVEARRAWPRVVLDLEVFRQHAAGVLGDELSSGWAAHGAELYLCCACAVGDAAAQAVLVHRYLVPLGQQLARSCKDRELLQEAMQATHIKLLVGARPKIGSYAARGPLSKWLQVAASRQLLDLIRARSAQITAARAAYASYPERDVEREPAILSAGFAVALREGLQHSIRMLDEEDRKMMKLAFIDGKTIDDLGDMGAIHRSTAARRLLRIQREIAASVRKYLTTRYALSREDARDIARDVWDDLDLNLKALLE